MYLVYVLFLLVGLVQEARKSLSRNYCIHQTESKVMFNGIYLIQGFRSMSHSSLRQDFYLCHLCPEAQCHC
ncbi:uncharacterized protein B0P05DRAFT_526005 [Gilbertella persicaria]|uniref:uncharacterized protein n=1 Tax=Gilbertella persicaria TaxID=101096 RepID=UPI002220BFC8|nr:uncharacterized protein B0P05DRAFT_526005 [Gilbertella persicaria]KAI8092367.1 hypothetical protein B0P05DRAFT_526005 [Gilbertella persicaria]